MDIVLSQDLKDFALVANNTLRITNNFSINSRGNAAYDTFDNPFGGPIIYNGTTPVGMGFTGAAKDALITEIYGPGGIHDQIYALPFDAQISGGITMPTTFTPGTYEFVGPTGPNFVISSTITLDGNSTDQWVFRSTSPLSFEEGFNLAYVGAPNSCNIYWASPVSNNIILNFFQISNPNAIVPGTFISGGDFNNFGTNSTFGPVFALSDINLSPPFAEPGLIFTSQSNECFILCVAPNTKVLSIDGTYIPISTLERGDYVASDMNYSKSHRIARIEKTQYSAISVVTLMTFEKGCLGENVPSTKLQVTSGHPIFYNGKRISAYCFRNLPGVTCETKHIRDLIEPCNGKYYLYDLQFEEDGSYVVEGVQVQSRKPRSFLTPLAKELYFNPELHVDKLETDYIHSSGIEFSPFEMLA